MLGHVVAKEREHYVAMSNARRPQWTDHNQTLLNLPALVGAAGTDGIGNQRGHEHERPPGKPAMISTTDPNSMTAEARRLEVANILARGAPV